MKPVLTPQQAAELDRATQDRGTPAAELMERAGRALARAAIEVAGGSYGRHAVVMCGSGNNGGDGLVAARHLARAGMRVRVVAPVRIGDQHEPVTANVARLDEQGLRLDSGLDDRTRRRIDVADVLVDAVFGTGFHGRPDGVWAEAIAAINASPAPVVAADIPSGVDGASGSVRGEAVRAVITVAFGAAKLGSVLLPGAERSGTVRVVDIGFPDDLLSAGVWLTEPADVAGVWPERALDAHKRRSGTVLVVAGSRAMTGAPSLIAAAAGRVGAGLVTIAAPAAALDAIQGHAREPVFLPLATTDRGTASFDALDPLLDAAARVDAVAIGPGLSRDEETARLVRELVGRVEAPVVLDADGLNAFAGDVEALLQRPGPLVVTPHDGEFERLMLKPVAEVAADRVLAATALAEAAGTVALLKGPRTVVAAPGPAARINPTGGPALATAGTGDLLTGAITGLIARGLSPFEAAWAGAFVHGVAGQAAALDLGDGALAGDVAQRLPHAIARVRGVSAP